MLTFHLEKSAGNNEEKKGQLLKLAARFREDRKLFSSEMMLDFISAYGEEKNVENIRKESQNREGPVN